MTFDRNIGILTQFSKLYFIFAHIIYYDYKICSWTSSEDCTHIWSGISKIHD